MKAKGILLTKLKKAQQIDLANKIDTTEYTNFKCKVLLLVLSKQEILLSFICGFIANLPISVLFNILTLDVFKYSISWIRSLYLVVYTLCLLSTIFLTIISFQFTIKYTRINNEADNLPNVITYCITSDNKNERMPLAYLVCKGKWFIVFAICTIITILALFSINLWGI